MNWAIIAREDRLYKGKSLFRWDESPGLGMKTPFYATPECFNVILIDSKSTIVEFAEDLFIVG